MTIGLPEPQFVDRDPVAITAEMIATYEAMSGRTLYPAQVERMLIDLAAYQETLVRLAIEEAARQNLLAYARAPMLDHLGALLDVWRLPAAPALTTLRFTRAAGAVGDRLIPAGTRVGTADRQAVFALAAPLILPAGADTAEAQAVCTTAGASGNGYVEGQVSTLLDPVGGVASVRNVTVTRGGAEREDDERLRSRIQEAPRSFSTAGPAGAYRWWARTAHQAITDVSVTSPMPGDVVVYPLTSDGLPTPEILSAVEALLTAEKVRPLTDHVTVAAPVPVDYACRVALTCYRYADAAQAAADVTARLTALTNDWRRRLGVDLVQSQIVTAGGNVPGVYRVAVLEPADRVLDAHAWARCTGVEVVSAGVADG